MGTVLVALRDRLLVCTGDGPAADGWTTTARLEGEDLECVAAAPDAPERYFVGTFDTGLFRSTDGGETFDPIETEFDALESGAVMAAAISPHDPGVVYAGTEPSRVYRSRDGGESWHERPPGSRRDNHSLATHPDREGRLYAAAGDGYAESDDGGQSWRRPQDGLAHTYCWSIVPDPGDPERVLVSSASGASTAHTASRAESYVYRREGNGAWERLEGKGLPMGDGVVRAVLDTTDEAGVVYAVNNRGLFVSEDFGSRWDRLDIDWSESVETPASRGLAVLDT